MSSSFQAATELSRRFLTWWGNELAELIPAALRRWASRDARRTVLAVENGGFIHYEESGGRLVRQNEAVLSAGEAAEEGTNLRGLGTGRSGGPIGIRLPRTACLIRRIELPAAARADFAKILKLDLERSTPFRLQDVYCDHVVEDGAPRQGKIWVRQVVVKREHIDPLVQQLAGSGVSVAFADCWDDAGKQGLPIDLLHSARQELSTATRRRLSTAAVMAACALLLSGSAVAIGLARYEAALQRLEEETDAAKANALAVRRSLTTVEGALGQVAELRRLKARPPVIRVLDELTRLLPDTAWVSYLKVEGGAVEVTIVAPATGELLALFERSPLFTGASLTAPVTYDAAGQSERATVRMTLKPPAEPVRAQRAAGSRS
jgi:general secretion pathway protein L